jgi:hypothetical protein
MNLLLHSVLVSAQNGKGTVENYVKIVKPDYLVFCKLVLIC